MGSPIVHSNIATLVAAFAQAEADTRRAFALIVAAQAQVSAVFTPGEKDGIRIDATGYGYHDNFDDPDRAVEVMARQAWRVIVDRLELRRAMSIARWERLQRQLEKEKLPPITEANVEAFVEDCMSNLRDMLGEAVSEVFEWLRPRRSEYKTNSELEIGRKVVLSRIVDRKHEWTGPGFRVDYDRQQNLIALENVFNAIDGKGQVGREHYSQLQRAIEASGAAGRGETELFRFRVFGNGNLHMEFRRLDLLTQFNQIAGGRRLRPKAAA